MFSISCQKGKGSRISRRVVGVKTLRTQDTSDLRHFGTGAEVSGHFGIGAEMSVRHFGTEVYLV